MRHTLAGPGRRAPPAAPVGLVSVSTGAGEGLPSTARPGRGRKAAGQGGWQAASVGREKELRGKPRGVGVRPVRGGCRRWTGQEVGSGRLHRSRQSRASRSGSLPETGCTALLGKSPPSSVTELLTPDGTSRGAPRAEQSGLHAGPQDFSPRLRLLPAAGVPEAPARRCTEEVRQDGGARKPGRPLTGAAIASAGLRRGGAPGGCHLGPRLLSNPDKARGGASEERRGAAREARHPPEMAASPPGGSDKAKGSITLKDVEWERLDPAQRGLNKNAVREKYSNLVPKEYQAPKPDMISKMEKREAPCLGKRKRPSQSHLSKIARPNQTRANGKEVQQDDDQSESTQKSQKELIEKDTFKKKTPMKKGNEECASLGKKNIFIGLWYSILLASDEKATIEENGSMRVFVDSIDVLKNSSLLFKFHTIVNGQCTEIVLACNKTEKDGVYSVKYDGQNVFGIADVEYDEYVIILLKNENNFQLAELYGRKPDVRTEIKEKFVDFCEKHGIVEENIVDLTKVDRCLQARTDKES
ncbi:uncharacterized protein RHO17_006304 [Thomomys bottae]